MWPKIIELLKEQGFSQKALAERVGVDQSTICRLAEGRAPEPRYSVGLALIELAGGVDALRVKGIVAGGGLPTDADPLAEAGQPVLILADEAAPTTDGAGVGHA